MVRIIDAGGSLPPQYGTGVDGIITVTTGTVKIEDIYEDENVTGVTTKYGVGKGLNHGAGTYDPENGAWIHAISFTVDSGATLTHGTAYGDGSSNKNGIVWISALVNIVNNGIIDLNGLGYSGAAGSAIANASGNDGKGYDQGYGKKGIIASGSGGIAGTAYGSSSIPATPFGTLFGSGGGSGSGTFGTALAPGGGGGANAANGTTGATSGATLGENGSIAAGNGGGAVRLYAPTVTISSGLIKVNGVTPATSAAGGGGGGAGGTVYIETFNGILGTDKITATKGNGGGVGIGVNAGAGGAGSVGRIHIEGVYSGSTSDPAIA